MRGGVGTCRLFLACFWPALVCFWLVAPAMTLACFVHDRSGFASVACSDIIVACFWFASTMLWLACFWSVFAHRRGVVCTYRLLLAWFLLALCLLCLACALPAFGNFPAPAQCFLHVWPALSGLLLARFVWPVLSGSGLLCPGRGHKIVNF